MGGEAGGRGGGCKKEMVKGRKSTHKHIFYICAFYKYLICAVLQNILPKRGMGNTCFCMPLGTMRVFLSEHLLKIKVKQKIRLSQYEIIFSTLLFCF